MKAASRFSIAVHILSLLAEFEELSPTSEWMAGSIGVNSVIVRNVTGMLRRAGLVSTQQGAAGARIAKPLGEVTLLDVFRAVEPDDDMLTIHSNANPACPVGARIESTLRGVYQRAENAMFDELAKTTIKDVVKEMSLAAR